MTARSRFTLAIAAVTMAWGFAATSARACEEHAQAPDAKDAKDAKPVAAADSKGCTMPCCAKKGTAEAKNVAPAAAVAPVAAVNDGAKPEAPCAAGKACPKKAATVAKAEPA
jgi:hypothetical protein